MTLKRDYWKWKVGAGRRGTLRRAGKRAGNGFEVMGACMAMLDHARRESHWIDNPQGAFTTTLDDLATDYCTPIARVREAMGALVAAGWLSVSPDVASAGDDDDLTVRVDKYLEFNYPQGSDADRKAAQRLRMADKERDEALGKTGDVQEVVTGGHETSVGSLEERREEREKGIDPTDLVGNQPTTKEPSQRELDIQNVYEYWIRTERETGGIGSTGKGRQPGARPTRDRRTKINARLAEGYTPADLKQAIAFYCRDPHHLGDNPQSVRYTDLTTTLKSASKVDAGIAGYAKRADTSGASSIRALETMRQRMSG
jgi:hypothetical protein